MTIVPRIDERLRPLLVECARSLFCAYGLEMQEGRGELCEHEIAGVIGFTGDVRGTLFVASTLPLFRATCPPPPRDVADWTAELANQLLGRFKNQLVRHGIALAMATPVAVRGLQLSCSTSHAPATFDVLHCSVGDAVVGLEAICDKPLRWVDDADAALDEGSLQLF